MCSTQEKGMEKMRETSGDYVRNVNKAFGKQYVREDHQGEHVLIKRGDEIVAIFGMLCGKPYVLETKHFIRSIPR
jgi:hypothetical protein